MENYVHVTLVMVRLSACFVIVLTKIQGLRHDSAQLWPEGGGLLVLLIELFIVNLQSVRNLSMTHQVISEQKHK